MVKPSKKNCPHCQSICQVHTFIHFIDFWGKSTNKFTTCLWVAKLIMFAGNKYNLAKSYIVKATRELIKETKIDNNN